MTTSREEVIALEMRLKELKEEAKRVKKELERKRVDDVNEWADGRTIKDILEELFSTYFPNEEMPSSIKQLRKKLKKLYINIYDHVAGRHHLKQRSKYALKIRCDKIGYFPSRLAKSENLQHLLQVLPGAR